MRFVLLQVIPEPMHTSQGRSPRDWCDESRLPLPLYFWAMYRITLVLLKVAQEMIVFPFPKPESAAASPNQHRPNRSSALVSFKIWPPKSVVRNERESINSTSPFVLGFAVFIIRFLKDRGNDLIQAP